MDTGEGRFEMSDGSPEAKATLESQFPNHGGWFRVDEVVELKGSQFRVKSVKPTEIRLKLLKR